MMHNSLLASIFPWLIVQGQWYILLCDHSRAIEISCHNRLSYRISDTFPCHLPSPTNGNSGASSHHCQSLVILVANIPVAESADRVPGPKRPSIQCAEAAMTNVK